jgi:hypothetical protein
MCRGRPSRISERAAQKSSKFYVCSRPALRMTALVTFRPNRRLHRRPPIGPVLLHELTFCIGHLPAAQISKKTPSQSVPPLGGFLLLKSE